MISVKATDEATNTIPKPSMTAYSSGNWFQLAARNGPITSLRLAAMMNEKNIDAEARAAGGSSPA